MDHKFCPNCGYSAAVVTFESGCMMIKCFLCPEVCFVQVYESAEEFHNHRDKDGNLWE